MKIIVLGLTLFRIIAAIIIFILIVFFESYWAAFWFFNLAALSDYLDGNLARNFGVESKLGAILDPIADKLLLLFSMMSIVVFTQNVYVAFIAAMILGREFWVSGLREFSSSINSSHSTKVSFLAKTKTTVQFIAISMYFFGAGSNLGLIIFLAHFVLFLSVLLAYLSAIHYTKNVFN